MSNKMKYVLLFAVATVVFPIAHAQAEVLDQDIEITDTISVEKNADMDTDMEQVSADAVSDYQVNGSLFQQITDLEQEKVLMQLEKERAQLDLELDRLAAEKIKLHMEIDTLSGRAEQQQQELDAAKAKLEAETAKLEREKQALENGNSAPRVASKSASASDDSSDIKIDEKYKLVNVFGVGNQLQATVADLKTGQNKKVSVGRSLDGFTVKSISLDDGIVFVSPSGTIQALNVTNAK